MSASDTLNEKVLAYLTRRRDEAVVALEVAERDYSDYNKARLEADKRIHETASEVRSLTQTIELLEGDAA